MKNAWIDIKQQLLTLEINGGFSEVFSIIQGYFRKRPNIRKSKYIMTVAKNQNKMIKAVNKGVWLLRANRVELCFPVIIYAYL